ncbi:hypothetical protein [Caballeronia sp. ATUFL_M2_KS44]|uniref:hypothetical protein n=1 Tax=Caballeronia sp. ATUFL_M2_KS44 TaxID=2921767 RepID=UPI002028DE04|nr:hypothetical protein [Caballeronia sp. ATUFL_M2_KS44]
MTPEQRAAAQQQADQLNAEWGSGGTYRQVLSALTVAAGGNVSGGAGQYAQAATVAYLQELGANEVKQIADNLGSEEARAALHAVVGCAGGAASGASCGAGAMGAAASSVLNSLLGSTEGSTTEQRNARTNAVGGLVAGIAAAMGSNGVGAAEAAQIETENNGASGTPGNNQAQNRQTRAVAVALKLTPDQAQELHRWIGGQQMGYQEIMEEARMLFNK